MVTPSAVLCRVREPREETLLVVKASDTNEVILARPGNSFVSPLLSYDDINYCTCVTIQLTSN